MTEKSIKHCFFPGLAHIELFQKYCKNLARFKLLVKVNPSTTRKNFNLKFICRKKGRQNAFSYRSYWTTAVKSLSIVTGPILLGTSTLGNMLR
jgi:hypothetical protein